MALPRCYADRTLVATMFETLTDINSFSPSPLAKQKLANFPKPLLLPFHY